MHHRYLSTVGLVLLGLAFTVSTVGATPMGWTPAAASCAAPPAPGLLRDVSTPAGPGRQIDFDARTETTFEMRPVDGGVELVGRSAGLLFRKQTARDGRVSLEITLGGDHASFDTSPDRIRIRLGRDVTLIDPRTATEDDYGNLRVQLAKSTAVRHFRRQMARLEARSDDDRPAVLGALTAGALVGVLDGDEGAPGRIARRIARRQAERLQAVSMSPGCFLSYEREVVTAWDDLELCYFSVSPLLWRACELRWLLWVESAWFSFISCSWGF